MSADAASSTPSAQSGGDAPFTKPVVDDGAGLELAGGSGPVTFDELESATRGVQAKKAQEKKEEHEAEKVAVKGEKKAKDKAKDEPEEKPVEKKEKEAPHEESVSEGSDKKESPVAQGDKKVLKLKSGDTEVPVSADALVTVRVDGKAERVPLQEVINRYSQRTHLDREYEQLKTQKQHFEDERTRINKVLEKSQKMLVEEQDLEGFLDWIGEAIGEDGATLYRQQIEKVQRELEEFAGLSPEERELRNLKRENERFKSRQQAAREEVRKQEAFKKLDEEVTGLITKEGMTKKELVTAYDDLIELGYDASQLNPDVLVKYHKNMQTFGTVQSLLTEINPELAKNDKVVADWVQTAILNGASPQMLKEAMAQVYEQESLVKAKALAKKMSKNERANRSSQPKNPGKDAMFFDDIV
jgi:hypothetical protein